MVETEMLDQFTQPLGDMEQILANDSRRMYLQRIAGQRIDERTIAGLLMRPTSSPLTI